MIVNNNEMYHIYVRIRHNETLKTVEQHRIGEQIKKSSGGR
jgi:hypothetical protein